MYKENFSTFKIRKNRHNSLTDFKNWLLRNTNEKVIDFDGITLTMKRGKKKIRYGMIDREIYEYESK